MIGEWLVAERSWLVASGESVVSLEMAAEDSRLEPAAGNYWWARLDLNQEPTDYESAALTVELRARLKIILQSCAVPSPVIRTVA